MTFEKEKFASSSFFFFFFVLRIIDIDPIGRV